MEVIFINAIILAAGDSQVRGSYFNPAADYLIHELAALGITARRGSRLTGETAAYLSGIGKAYKENALIFILTAPQPRTAAAVSAVVAKGMKLELEANHAAKEQLITNIRQTDADTTINDMNELTPFFVLPTGAVAFANPLGWLQGYAVGSSGHLLVVLPADGEGIAECLNGDQLSQLLTQFSTLQHRNDPPLARLSALVARLVPQSHASGSYAKTSHSHTERDTTTMARTSLIDRLRAGKLTPNDKIRLGAVAVFLAIFVGCMIYIGSVYKESADNKTLSGDLKELVTNTIAPDKVRGGYPKDYLTKFTSLYDQNADVAGWIKIPDTKLDYVVVQAADNDYYERRDFTRKDNQHGVPYVDYRVDQEAPSTNTVIYAHNMNDGQMFGELMNYKKLSFYQAHPVIEYDSVYHEGKYKIFGVVLCKKDDPDFNYHNFIEKGDDKAMTEYVNKIRERSLINAKVDMRVDDTLITLSTCDYDFKSSTGDRIARFVVFARKVRPGESAEVDVAGATLNLNPVMPTEWYDALARQQAAERKKQEEAQASQSASSAAAAVSSKWISASEAQDLTPEEQKRIAEQRQADAKKYLTYDEQQDYGLDDMLSLISDREYAFGLYLATDEQKLSISKRIALAEEHSDLAHQWLTDEEIRKAGRWSRIEALIAERQSGAVPAPDKWLTAEENKTLSASQKSALRSQRQADAKKAGVTQSEISSATTWEEIEALIAGKQGAGTAEQYIKNNPKWLNNDDKGLSLDELKALVNDRKAMAADAGIDPAKYSSWNSMQRAIDEANNAKRDKLFSSNKAWLNSGDAGLSYSQMSKLITERKAIAATAKVTAAELAGSSSWSDTEKIIQNKLNPPTPPPITPTPPPVTPTPPPVTPTPPPVTPTPPPVTPTPPPVTPTPPPVEKPTPPPEEKPTPPPEEKPTPPPEEKPTPPPEATNSPEASEPEATPSPEVTQEPVPTTQPEPTPAA